MIAANITDSADRARGSQTKRAVVLAGDWERASAGPIWHPPTCACGAGMPAISMASAEADLIDFLQAAANSDGDRAAGAVIAQRQTHRSFSDWLQALSQADLPPASLERLLDRIENFIESVRHSHGHIACH